MKRLLFLLLCLCLIAFLILRPHARPHHIAAPPSPSLPGPVQVQLLNYAHAAHGLNVVELHGLTPGRQYHFDPGNTRALSTSYSNSSAGLIPLDTLPPVFTATQEIYYLWFPAQTSPLISVY